MHSYYSSSFRKRYVSYENLLDYNVYHIKDIENFGSYVLLKYQLNDLIAQHIDGCNPLFMYAILKEVDQVAWSKIQDDFLC